MKKFLLPVVILLTLCGTLTIEAQNRAIVRPIAPVGFIEVQGVLLRIDKIEIIRREKTNPNFTEIHFTSGKSMVLHLSLDQVRHTLNVPFPLR